MSFAFPDSLKLAHLPTPIARLERLSKTFEGPQIYIKRDDYTGMAATGNKIRKLVYAEHAPALVSKTKKAMLL